MQIKVFVGVTRKVEDCKMGRWGSEKRSTCSDVGRWGNRIRLWFEKRKHT